VEASVARARAGALLNAWPRLDTKPYMREFDATAWTCWHLVMEFYERELGILLPSYGVERYPDGVRVREAIADALASGRWEAVVTDEALTQARRTRSWATIADATAFGDVLAFGISEHGHVGVVTKRLHMLQVSEGLAARETRYDAPAWGPLLTGIYRWIH
jgi:cell wall-associated NlpC family hydrolase